MAIWPRGQADWLRLRRLVQRATRDPQQVEDRLQSGLLKMLTHSAPIDNPEGFLGAVTRNMAIDDARKAEVRREIDAGSAGLHLLAAQEALPDEVFVARKRLEQVTLALDTLPARTRRIFLMHRLDGMRYREIAAREQVSVSSVEKHMAKAVLFITQWDDAD